MSNLFDLTGSRALITGSSQGIGLALAAGLARQGASVIINGRTEARVDEACATLAAQGLKAERAIFDVTEKAEVDAGIEKIEREIGPIDILINNAGMQYRTQL